MRRRGAGLKKVPREAFERFKPKALKDEPGDQTFSSLTEVRRFLRRIAAARTSLRKGRGLRFEDLSWK